MTISFDRVGDCPNAATVTVEGYSAKDGTAHGSLDVTVRSCSDCRQAFRTQIISCGLTAYSPTPQAGGQCGDRATYEPNKFSTAYEGSPRTSSEDRGAPDTATREAVRAFYRLHQTTAAVVTDPFNPGALETLRNAAEEANAKMRAAGLLDLSQQQVIELVRAEFPGYDPSGGVAAPETPVDD